MTDLANLKGDKVVDARAMACPGPLLEAKKAMGSVPVGKVLEISVVIREAAKIFRLGARRQATCSWGSPNVTATTAYS